MSYHFRGGNRVQLWLMPPSIEDWLPPEHLRSRKDRLREAKARLERERKEEETGKKPRGKPPKRVEDVRVEQEKRKANATAPMRVTVTKPTSKRHAITDDRTGLRSDQERSQNGLVLRSRTHFGQGRMESDLRDDQPAEAVRGDAGRVELRNGGGDLATCRAGPPKNLLSPPPPPQMWYHLGVVLAFQPA